MLKFDKNNILLKKIFFNSKISGLPKLLITQSEWLPKARSQYLSNLTQLCKVLSFIPTFIPNPDCPRLFYRESRPSELLSRLLDH